jgi:23S rRNA (adenine2503-C2)-methyltransferase
MNERIILLGKSLGDLEELMTILSEPKFRAKQIADWLDSGVSSFDQMKNIPKSLRTKLSEIAAPLPCIIKQKLTSADKSTTKLLLEFSDPGAGISSTRTTLIETVLMRTRYGNSVCISSEAGCAMGCKFCASTLRGLDRNLSAVEMLSQVRAAASILTIDRISHVVIMGSGEPLLNIDNTIEFMELLNSKAINFTNRSESETKFKTNISWRKITLSTCGIPPGIRRLTEWGKPINLAVSLHAPSDELRTQIMPINAKYPISEIIKATDEWQAATGRQLTFEYIVLGGVNDSQKCAQELVNLIGRRDIFVNLIPYNPVAERELIAPSGNAVHRIKDILEKNKIPCAIRFERGSDINSACGQLRNQNS